VFYSAPVSGARRIRSQICMTHVPETGAAEKWRRLMAPVSEECVMGIRPSNDKQFAADCRPTTLSNSEIHRERLTYRQLECIAFNRNDFHLSINHEIWRLITD